MQTLHNISLYIMTHCTNQSLKLSFKF